MPNKISLDKYRMDDFQIDNFEPRHLKKANISLQKHLNTVYEYENINNEYKKNILKESTFWERIKHTLHLN